MLPRSRSISSEPPWAARSSSFSGWRDLVSQLKNSSKSCINRRCGTKTGRLHKLVGLACKCIWGLWFGVPRPRSAALCMRCGNCRLCICQILRRQPMAAAGCSSPSIPAAMNFLARAGGGGRESTTIGCCSTFSQTHTMALPEGEFSQPTKVHWKIHFHLKIIYCAPFCFKTACKLCFLYLEF